MLVSDTDKAEALKLGRHPDLAGEILRDMEKLGLIGEATNKLIGYLVMTSRKMPDPLALLTLIGQRCGQEPFAGHHSLPLSRRGFNQADFADRPGVVLQGRGLAEK